MVNERILFFYKDVYIYIHIYMLHFSSAAAFRCASLNSPSIPDTFKQSFFFFILFLLYTYLLLNTMAEIPKTEAPLDVKEAVAGVVDLQNKRVSGNRSLFSP